ncbi:MAG: biopolymer transporter ExbD [Verrucomicrobiales bacterium]|nr:biopolymer transporter ExbD [Verrucomicrobiales bacterium]
MARRKTSNPFGGGTEPELSISPLIDVGFLLLIYFLVTTTLMKQELDLNLILPGVATVQSEPVKVDQMLIKISPDGTISVNEEVVESDPNNRELPNLSQRLESYAATAKLAGSEAMVVIACDDEAMEQRFVDVLNSCGKAGLKNISLTE